MKTCPICKGQHAKDVGQGFFPGAEVECDRCGAYRVTDSALAARVSKLTDPQRVLVSGWIREQNEMGSSPRILDDDVERILQLQRPTLKERAERILAYLIRRSPQLNSDFEISSPALCAVAYVADLNKLRIVLRYLTDNRLIEYPPRAEHKVRVTPSGHVYADELGVRNRDSLQAFVAMWFDTSMGDAYQAGFERAISTAGYRAMRIDKHEHANRIDDEIIAQIRRSRFMVADFTDQRGGVYFEAGFAWGLHLPVIWTCRKDWFGQLHFDIRQFNCIEWTDPESLAEPLQMRIEAVVGRGSLIA
jgi:hypothetical protein